MSGIASPLIIIFSEDLNILVKQHIKQVVSRGFSRALATLESDVNELLESGMLTLSAKFGNLEDEKLLPRSIEVWVLFYDQILPYVEGVSHLAVKSSISSYNIHVGFSPGSY